MEICRFGCPEHCQNPSSYVAREQEVSSSINGNYESPVPVPAPTQYQADVPPTTTYQGAAAPPSSYQSGTPLPPPPPPVGYRQNYQQNGPPRKRQSPPPPPSRPGPGPNNKNFQIDPRGKKVNKAPEALPNPQPLQAEEEVRSLESARHRARAADAADSHEAEEGEAKQAAAGGGIANFLGLKLPELPTLPSFPFFGGKKAAEKTDVKIEPSGEAIAIPLGVKPGNISPNTKEDEVSLPQQR